MMMPTLSTSSSSIAATIRVHKATSELLVAPDWSMNMEICDYCNSNRWSSKDVVKEMKRRLHHKNSKVQLLTLMLLEMMVKNCGDYIHHQIAERKILDEMIKIVKKKGDVNVRDKILSLLDSWQETYGGPGGKHSQYYWACDELRRYGIQFPHRSQRSTSIVTPSLTNVSKASQVGFSTSSNLSRRLDEAMTSEVESLSLSTLESMRNVLELLNDMLQAVNPNDRMAVKEEVIVDLVDRSRSNQKKLMQMITTTTEEDLLAQGIEMNDSLQIVLAKHDAIASGAPLSNYSSFSGQMSSCLKTRKAKDKNPVSNDQSSSSFAPPAKDQSDEDEEEEDEFGQLAQRHSKAPSTPSQSTIMGANEDGASSSSSNSNALVLIDVPAPTPTPTTTSTTKEQELIDLLSIVLSTSSSPSETTQVPTPTSEESLLQEPLNNYVVPWAQPQQHPQPQQLLPSLPQFQTQYQQVQPQLQPQYQMGCSQYSSGYPPSPWEGAYGYPTNQNLGSNPYMSQGIMNGSSTWPSHNFNSFQGSQYGNQPMYANAINSSQMQGMQSLQQVNSFQYPTTVGNHYSNPQPIMNPPTIPTQGAQSLQVVNSNPPMNGSTLITNGSNSVPHGQHKPFIPSYRLFEELNVFGSTEGKMKSGPYPSASGNSSQNMVTGRRQINLLD